MNQEPTDSAAPAREKYERGSKTISAQKTREIFAFKRSSRVKRSPPRAVVINLPDNLLEEPKEPCASGGGDLPERLPDESTEPGTSGGGTQPPDGAEITSDTVFPGTEEVVHHAHPSSTSSSPVPTVEQLSPGYITSTPIRPRDSGVPDSLLGGTAFTQYRSSPLVDLSLTTSSPTELVVTQDSNPGNLVRTISQLGGSVPSVPLALTRTPSHLSASGSLLRARSLDFSDPCRGTLPGWWFSRSEGAQADHGSFTYRLDVPSDSDHKGDKGQRRTDPITSTPPSDSDSLPPLEDTDPDQPSNGEEFQPLDLGARRPDDNNPDDDNNRHTNSGHTSGGSDDSTSHRRISVVRMARPVIKFQAPPIFHGRPDEDALDWLTRYEQIGAYNGWGNADLRNYLVMHLDGPARKWYQCLRPGDIPAEWHSVPEVEEDTAKGIAAAAAIVGMRELFLKQFLQGDYKRYQLRQLRSRVQGENEDPVAYFYDILDRCRKIDPGMLEDDKLEYLFQGLNRT